MLHGLSTSEFLFIGFLPVKNTEKEKKLLSLKDEERTLIFYEAPHKLLGTLTCLRKILGNRKITIAKELTKIHETFFYLTLDKAIELFESENIKGEFVLVVEGNTFVLDDMTQNLNTMSLEEHFMFYSNLGLSKNDIIKKIAKDRHVNKNEIYKHFIKK